MSVPTSTHRSRPISPTVLVSLVAPTWLLAIVALNTGTELLEQLGVASEEVFRGDRLPVLHFPTQPD
jgi:hypothetical protein